MSTAGAALASTTYCRGGALAFPRRDAARRPGPSTVRQEPAERGMAATGGEGGEAAEHGRRRGCGVPGGERVVVGELREVLVVGHGPEGDEGNIVIGRDTRHRARLHVGRDRVGGGGRNADAGLGEVAAG